MSFLYKLFLILFSKQILSELYHLFLRRDLDVNGQTAYTQAMLKQRNISFIIESLMKSDEYKKIHRIKSSKIFPFEPAKSFTNFESLLENTENFIQIPISKLPNESFVNSEAKYISGMVYCRDIDRNRLKNLKIFFHGHKNPRTLENVVIVLRSIPNELFIAISDTDQQIVFEDGCEAGSWVFHLFGHDAKALIGANSSSNGCEVFINPNGLFQVGADCMFAAQIMIHVGDNHAIVDIDSEEVLNLYAQPYVQIQNHVWVGQRVSIIGNSTVGKGSVIGTGAVVKGEFSPFSLIAGNSAKIVCENITWTRSYYGDDKANIIANLA